MDAQAKNLDAETKDPDVAKELERAAANKGVVAIYADPESAEAARRSLKEAGLSGPEPHIISDPHRLTPMALTPTEPEPRRTSRVAFGAAGGLVAGAVLGIAFYAGYPASPLTAVFSLIAGMAIGVLYGATLAGLCMPPYRDDTVNTLRTHVSRGHVLLVAVGDDAQLRKTRDLLGETKPLELLSS